MLPAMLVPVLVSFFKYKVVRSVFILACWRSYEQMNFIREISEHGLSATFVCNPDNLDHIQRHGLQGVIHFTSGDKKLEKFKSEHFCGRYVWLVIGDMVPEIMNQVRYDADITLLRTRTTWNRSIAFFSSEPIYLQDIYVNPSVGASLYPWANWSHATGLYIAYERNRILRRLDFGGYSMRIAAPMGQYSDHWYNGTFAEYVVDETLTELDAGIRSGYATSVLIIDRLNATELLIPTELWSTTINNSSMYLMLLYGSADLSGAILRILTERLENLDYVMPIWPFNVGFTYLSERQSSSNMFLEPFTVSVWWTCLGVSLILAIAQRITAKSQEEKDDAFYAVLATFLQQDASAVPNGISGRWTFMVLSVSSMLIHAYYTSAIVSALMNAGSGGPDSLKSLADSKYSIGSEDYDYMRYLFFDVETTWDDLEYLKRKKKTSTFYQELERGVELIQEGNTAFHSEYNQIYPHFKTFTDEQVCKLQHVDTIPEVLTWITATPNGQFTNTFRSAGAWIQETGLGKRLVSRLQALRPPCRAQLLAERVKFGDVAPLMGLTTFGAVLSLILLGLEILVAKKCNGRKNTRLLSIDGNANTSTVDEAE